MTEAREPDKRTGARPRPLRVESPPGGRGSRAAKDLPVRHHASTSITAWGRASWRVIQS
jgi:hypothetical protein